MSPRPRSDEPNQPPPGTSLAELASQVRALLAPWFKEKRFSPGTLLWREDDTTGMLVAIRTGRVKIYRLLPTGKAVTLFIFGPDDVFGFLPFLDGMPYPAYAQAMDEVTAEVMTRSGLLEAIRSRPDIALTLFSFLGKRLRDAFDRIENLSSPGVVSRVAAALHALLPQPVPAPPIALELPVNAGEFAAAIGISPETLSRSVSRLAADGVVHRISPRRLQVTDPTALERMAHLARR